MGLERIIIDTGKPGASPVGSVIWMHGFGADAHDFEPVIPMLDLAAPLRFVFPNAPLRPTTIRGGAKLRTWYDINPQAPLAAAGEIKASPIVAVFRKNIEKGDPIYPRHLEGPYPFHLSQVSCSKLMAFPEALYLVIEALDEPAQRRWRVAVEVRYTCLVGLRRSLARINKVIKDIVKTFHSIISEKRTLHGFQI